MIKDLEIIKVGDQKILFKSELGSTIVNLANWTFIGITTDKRLDIRDKDYTVMNVSFEEFNQIQTLVDLNELLGLDIGSIEALFLTEMST